jgi:hypothetical protein
LSLNLDPDAFPEGFDTDALERGHEAMKEIVETMEGVRLVVTSEFSEAVRTAHKDAEYAAAYEQDRGEFGVAMAKVVDKEDGGIDVIVDARVLTSGQELGVPEHTFKHEAYHVAMRQRGESLLDLALDEDGEFGVDLRYIALAGTACEEFRIEAVLCKERPNGHYESFAGLLAAVDSHLQKLSRDYQTSPDELSDAETISRGVGDQFQSVVTACGYVAAVMKATGKELPEIDSEVSQRVLGSYGVAVIERLMELPPADSPTELDLLEGAVEEVAELLVLWISEIGFRWEDEDDGGFRFRVLKPQKWLFART